mmetsp:Transcript_23152/g.38097  ORF Transcript_23152/g.38097 Transcript_23152/m.38097 type:complete len:187 (+) Transcript_23152:93-653(+)
MSDRKLFDGAIEVKIDPQFVDVSDFRPVPDSQEVFSNEANDRSIIVEIMEYVHDTEDACAAVGEHFREIAALNDALDRSHIIDVRLLRDDEVPHLAQFPKSLLFGLQGSSKGRSVNAPATSVYVFLACLRLLQVDSDILVTMNVGTGIPYDPLAIQHSALVPPPDAMEQFLTVLRSFAIKDWGLFG